MEGEKDTDSTLTLNRIASLGNITRIHLRARSSEFTPMDDVEFFFAVELDDGTRYAATEVTFKRFRLGTPMGCFIDVPAHALHQLANDLWDVRVRPHDALASTGQLETINNHLTDLRRLVFDYDVRNKPGGKGGDK